MQTPASQTQLSGGKPPSNEPFPHRGLSFYGRPTLPGGQPPFHAPPGGQPPFSSHTPVVNPPLAGGKPSFAGNPGEYLQEALLFNPTLGGTRIITP
jgi:hypothetical protein